MTARQGLSIAVVIAAVVWAIVAIMRAVAEWPRISLDMAAGDASTQAALRTAEWQHIATHSVLALGPLLGVLFLVWALRQRQPKSQ